MLIEGQNDIKCQCIEHRMGEEIVDFRICHYCFCQFEVSLTPVLVMTLYTFCVFPTCQYMWFIVLLDLS